MNTALIQLKGCKDRKASVSYHGKRVAFIYKAKNQKTNINYKCIWGKVTTSHGQSGKVRATFARNLPSGAFGTSVRVMMYPNKQI